MNPQLLVDIFVILAIIGVLIYFIRKFDKFVISYGPEVLTTLGILGCFFGVVLALWNLDTKDIIGSMPNLLGGIRTAFISSICGVLGAIIIRAIHRFKKFDSETGAAMTDNSMAQESVNILRSLKDGLIGSEKDALLSHFKLMRQEQLDGQKNLFLYLSDVFKDQKESNDSLIKAFNNFAEEMTKNNQEAIINALKQVIEDFNTNLTTQFGENFKALNEAVGKLVTWQNQYKEELEIIKIAQTSAANDMRVATNAMSVFVSNSEQFSIIAKDLSDQMHFLSNSRDVLIAQQESLAILLNNLSKVTPEFSEKANQMLDSINRGMAQINNEAQSLIASIKQAAESHRVDLKKSITDSSAAINSDIKGVLEKVATQISSLNTEFGEFIKSAQNKTSTSLNEGLETIKKGVIALDTGMQTQLNNALDGLARQLGSLSNKFAQDYSPITDRLREILKIGEEV